MINSVPSGTERIDFPFLVLQPWRFVFPGAHVLVKAGLTRSLWPRRLPCLVRAGRGRGCMLAHSAGSTLRVHPVQLESLDAGNEI